MAEVLLNLLGDAPSKLFSTIFKEFGPLVGVKEEEGALESKLQVIRSVIRGTEGLQLKDDSAKVFIQKLKDAAYDVEDVVDEFMTEALRQKVETRDGMQKKVRNFFSTSNALVFRLKMAHKIQALKKRIDAIVKVKRDFYFKELLGVDIPPPPVSQGRETCSYVNKDEIFGRADDKANVIRTLIHEGNESSLSVIAIVGMGGMGKTTLAKSVFNDQSVVTHFHSRKWIYVSDEFDVKSLLKKILQSPSDNASGQPNRGPSQTSDESSMKDLQSQLRIALSKMKYLLVLDDVWNECRDKWLELESLLRCGAVGSKILVTTRSDEVASIMGALQTPPLRALPENECLSLFKKLAFGDKQEPNENLVKIGEEIVIKCRGVPLAVKIVGSLMYSKESEIEWLRVRDSETWLQDEDTGILPALRLSYNHLTPSLKECFAYCALFPKGDEISVVDLISQWIAKGFIQPRDELLEEKAEDCFKTLWSRSFFQDMETDGYGDMKYCTMHDLVHDLARAVAGYGFAFSGMHNHTTLQKTRHLSMIGRPVVGFKKTRHLIMEDPTEVALKNMKAFKFFDKMRSMFFVDTNSEVNMCFRFPWSRLLDVSDSSISYLPKSIGKLKHLRYLDLSWTYIEELPETICNLFNLRTLILKYNKIKKLPESIGKLKHLRYLDVSYTHIEELPETICNLFNLQTLILKDSNIKKLPEGMGRMITLRHVEFDDDIEHMPNGIGELFSLRTLPKFIVGEKSGGCGIEELKILNLLRGHLSIERLENIKYAPFAREASLKEKKYLRSLTLSYGWEVGDTPEGILEDVIQCLEPHSSLKRLSIEGYMGRKFPSWMEQINLVELSLSNCKRGQHLPQLVRLHSLESLSLSHMGAIEYIVEFDSGYDKKSIFPSLKKLVICDLCNLKGWSIMPNLEGLSSQQAASNDGQLKQAEASLFLPCLLSLDISSCLKLTHFPSLVLPALQELVIKDCPNLVPFHNGSQQLCLNSLKVLTIWNSCKQLTSFPRGGGDGITLTSLRELYIRKCENLEHLFEGLKENHITSLERLEIINCQKLGNLPEWLGNLTSLKKLMIINCPSMNALPTKLQKSSSDKQLLFWPRGPCLGD